MKTYGQRTCWICKKLVSSAGFAFHSHMKKHEREGSEEARRWIREGERDKMRRWLK